MTHLRLKSLLAQDLWIAIAIFSSVEQNTCKTRGYHSVVGRLVLSSCCKLGVGTIRDPIEFWAATLTYGGSHKNVLRALGGVTHVSLIVAIATVPLSIHF
jgi:hypothetical protein